MKSGQRGRSTPDYLEDADTPSAEEGGTPWHEVLGVPESAAREDINAAYKAKISQYHPDKVAGMAAEIRDIALARSKEINAAYQQAMRLRD
jgi:DnaJ-class molecular chaperone